MTLIDKFLDAMRLNDDDDYDDFEFANDEYLDDDDDYEVPEKKTLRREKKVEPKNEFKEKEKEKAKPISKITPIGRANKKQETSTGMEVCVIKPTTIEDELEITDTLLNGRTVVINMEGLQVELAQRIIDFICGSVYAMHGNLQKISNYIFLATPNGVDISGDIQNLMDAFGSNDGGFKF